MLFLSSQSLKYLFDLFVLQFEVKFKFSILI